MKRDNYFIRETLDFDRPFYVFKYSSFLYFFGYNEYIASFKTLEDSLSYIDYLTSGKSVQ